MAIASDTHTGIQLGCAAIPVHGVDGSPLRVCVVVRTAPAPGEGTFVLLRDLPDASVHLGCVTDAAGQIREWLEVWVQNVDGLNASLLTHRDVFGNQALDQRWASEAAAAREFNPMGLVWTGWETTHPRPTWLDLKRRLAIQPGSAEAGGAWELCQDDALLAEAGLPAYSTSTVRYLHQPAVKEGRRFVPVVGGAPQNEVTQPLKEAVAGIEEWESFNPQGGLLRVATLFPIPFGDFVDMLGGKPWEGIELGRSMFQFGEANRGLGDATRLKQGGGDLFLGGGGLAGRMAEVFHLKLQALADVFRLVRAFVQRHQLPFLNLGADSFRVRLGAVGTGLPALWTAACGLAKPGVAFALPVPAGEFRYFVRSRVEGASAYLPPGLREVSHGSGSVRLRKIMPAADGRIVAEGTLVAGETLTVSPHDLIGLRLPLAGKRVELFGHLYSEEGLAHGEARFRTLPQRFDEACLKNLREAEGVSLPNAPFEVVPLLSTPCDLHALAILAVRTLLVDTKITLAVATDEMLSLARRLAAEHRPDRELRERIAALFAADARYLEALGPHRLMHDGVEAQEALRLAPAELWFAALAWVVRLFPGVGPDSLRRDLGDAPPQALETVFDEPLAELEKLLCRSRSLIAIDWSQNREIHAMIRACLEEN